MIVYGSSLSPFVRKVMVVAHELGLAGRIELLPTTVSPVQANEALSGENPLMKVPSLATDDGQALFDSPEVFEFPVVGAVVTGMYGGLGT